MIIVDSNIGFGNLLKTKLGTSETMVISKAESLKKAAAEVVSTLKNDNQLILINVESIFVGDDILAQQGIDVLIWLRCAWQIKNPIILYGFQKVEHLLKQKPENLIILCEGCYYHRLPDEILEINNKQFKGVADLAGIKPYLQSALNMEYYRHRFANKWGIHRLMLAYKTIIDKKLIESQSIPDTLEEAVAQFIYVGNEDLSLSPDIKLNIIYNQVKYHQSRLRDKRILYIDDQAKEGWSQVLFTVLGINSEMLIVKSIISDDLDMEFSTINQLISNHQPDCILLDLRLLPSKDERVVDNKNYSGAKLTKKIKKKYPSLPIILFSASNKAENLRIALQSGCETLWTKEGIDDYKGWGYSINNCFRLAKLVSDACNKFGNIHSRLNYESDLMIAGLEKRAHAINIGNIKRDKPELELLDKIDVFIPDTSFLIETNDKQTVKHQANLYLFIYILKCIYKKPVYIIDDVLLEIIRHSKKIAYTDSDEVDRIERSRYMLAKLYDWSRQGLIRFGRADTNNYASKMRSDELEVSDLDKNENDEDISFLNSWIKKLLPGLLSKPIHSEEENETITNFSRGLHADDTFAKEIPELVLKDKSVLFLCDDWRCRMTIGINVLDSVSGKEPLKVETLIYPKDGKEFPVLIVNKDWQIIYKNMWSGEFGGLMDGVRESILKRSILE